MEEFSIKRALELGAGRLRTRCGFKVRAVGGSGDAELPVSAIVAEEVTTGRGRRKKAHIEDNLVFYHADGRLYEDKDDDFDLVIMEK